MPEPDVEGAVDWSLARRRNAVGQSILDLDEDPDRAARAIQLSQASGAPPSAIHSDLDYFESQYKAGVTADILNNNSALRDWVERNPMASKIANDDWGQLDKVTEKLKPFQVDIAAPFMAGVKGFIQGTAESLGEAEPSLVEGYEKLPSYFRTLVYTGAAKAALLSSMLAGASRMVFESTSEAARQVGVSESEAKRFGRGMAELGEGVFMDAAHKGVVVHDADAYAMRFKQSWDKAEPWLKQGKLPPKGIDTFVDKMLAEQAKHDTATLDEVLDEAERSPVRDRSPETFADLIRGSVGDKNVAIPFDAVQEIYGNKLPSADDGILGWAPDFAKKYREAAESGGDILIPMADFVAKLPPEVRSKLKDKVKPDPNGMNLEEAEEADKAVPESPIVEFKRQEAKITAALPEVKEGFTRLWRGSRPGEEHTASAYTSDLGGIALPFQKSYGGKLTYVDVPTVDLAKYENKAGTATGVEFNVPPEVVKRAEVVPLEDTIRQGAGLDQVNTLQPVLLEEGQSEAPLFGKMAIGLPKVLYDKWIRTIEKQSAAEKARELKTAADEIRRTKTKQWKEESVAMRPEVTNEVFNRPEWIAHHWFNDGLLQGVKGEKPKFDPARLTPEQRKAIPKAYQKKGGGAPDDFANVAGFETGDEMVDVMGKFYKNKATTPIGEYLDKQVTAEVAQRMEAKYGRPADAILAEAQDHVTGIPQLERLHETVVALGLKAGKEPTFSKEDVLSAAKESMSTKTVGEQSRDAYLRESGKAGRDMIKAFLKQDWNEAFRLGQRQYIANILAREAGKLDTSLKKFDKLAKKFSKVEDPEAFKGPLSGVYVPYIQQLLSRANRRVGRTPGQIKDAIAQGGYGTFEEFARAKGLGLRDVEVPQFEAKSVEQMTVKEFQDLHRAVKILDKLGRDESAVYREGQAADFEEIRDQMVEKLRTLGNVKIQIHKEPMAAKKLWNTYVASSLTPESILNRWDRDNAMGVFNQYIVRPLAEASNYKAKLIRVYQDGLLKAAGKIPDIDKMVENSLWLDPYTKEPLTMSKRNVLGTLMYWGNKSSRKKLLEGYNVSEEEGLKWLLDRTTKEDWDRAQDIGHVFKRLMKLADGMSMEINGVPVKKIDITPFDTPHGKYEGWYNPVQYEPLFPGRVTSDVAELLKAAETVNLKGERVLEQPGFYRANTNQDYTKTRTEYVAPIAMDLDVIPIRLKQMIHDIAFRPAVLQASKFFYDPKWQAAVIHHYGPDYKNIFVPFLKDVANFSNDTGGFHDSLLEKFRQNLIATMIGFNPHTVAKHGMTAAANSMTEVGPINFLKATASLFRTNDETATTNYRFAMDRSEELQRRMRNIQAYIVHEPEISLEKLGWRQTLMQLGAKPVATSDLASSVPTWLAQFEKSKRSGASEGQAIFEADRAVRRAHGSSVITNLPELVRTNALGRTFSSLYGFFSHMLQKQFELSWKAADAFKGIKTGDLSVAKAYAPQLAWGFVSYVIIPAVVEELVTPYLGSEKDSWGVKAAKTLGLGLTASWIGVKDFAHGVLNATEPTAGLIGTAFKEGTKLTRDLSHGRGIFDKRLFGKFIRDTFFVVGALTGYVNAQEGRALQFAQRWWTGVDRPKSPWDWMHGLTTGTLEKKRR